MGRLDRFTRQKAFRGINSPDKKLYYIRTYSLPDDAARARLQWRLATKPMAKYRYYKMYTRGCGLPENETFIAAQSMWRII